MKETNPGLVWVPRELLNDKALKNKSGQIKKTSVCVCVCVYVCVFVCFSFFF